MGKLSAVTPWEKNLVQWRILLPGAAVVLVAPAGSRALLS